MNVVVLGATGLIGTKLVRVLQQRGHHVVPASPSTGVDVLTGKGLARALSGAQAVIDVTNSPSSDDASVLRFFETGGRNILAAEATAGVSHHVALSVVGTERLQESGYFRAKLAQEELIEASGIPFTILRSTQFFEFVSVIAQAATVGTTVRLPSALVQPVLSDNVVSVLADLAVAAPLNGTAEVAGPEALRLDDLVRRLFDSTADSRTVATHTHARYFGAPIDDRSLTPGPSPRIGTVRFEDWLTAGNRPEETT